MEELKVHIRHVMSWEFKNNKNAIESAKKICSVYGQSAITDHQVWNWFSKIHSGDMSLSGESRPGCSSDLNQYALREFLKCNPHKSTQELALDLNIFQSTISYHLKKKKKKVKVSKLGVWVPHTLCTAQKKKQCFFMIMQRLIQQKSHRIKYWDLG